MERSRKLNFGWGTQHSKNSFNNVRTVKKKKLKKKNLTTYYTTSNLNISCKKISQDCEYIIIYNGDFMWNIFTYFDGINAQYYQTQTSSNKLLGLC